MRRYAFAGVIAANAAGLALAMVLVNFAFEAAGSVPDLEGCGFLAGSLLSLAFIYPLVAVAMGARTARSLTRRGVESDVIARAGAAVGALGAGFYFGLGCYSVMRGPHGAAVSPNLWALAAVFVLGCSVGGKIGATVRPAGAWPYLLRRTGN